jgi:hypothetical protein
VRCTEASEVPIWASRLWYWWLAVFQRLRELVLPSACYEKNVNLRHPIACCKIFLRISSFLAYSLLGSYFIIYTVSVREYCVGKKSRGFERYTCLEFPLPQYKWVTFGALSRYVYVRYVCVCVCSPSVAPLLLEKLCSYSIFKISSGLGRSQMNMFIPVLTAKTLHTDRKI